MNSQQPGIPGAADLRVSMMSSSMPSATRNGRGTSDATEGFSSFLDRYSGEKGRDGASQQNPAAGPGPADSGESVAQDELRNEQPSGSEESAEVDETPGVEDSIQYGDAGVGEGLNQDVHPDSGNPPADSGSGLSAQLSEAVTTDPECGESGSPAMKDPHLSAEPPRKDVSGLLGSEDSTKTRKTFATGGSPSTELGASMRINHSKGPLNPNVGISPGQPRVLVRQVSQSGAPVPDQAPNLKGQPSKAEPASKKDAASLQSKSPDRNPVNVEDGIRSNADKTGIAKPAVDPKDTPVPVGHTKSAPVSGKLKYETTVETVESGKPAVEIGDKSKSNSVEKSRVALAAAMVSRHGNQVVSEAKPVGKAGASVLDQKATLSSVINAHQSGSDLSRPNGNALPRMKAVSGNASGVANGVQKQGTVSANVPKDAVLSGPYMANEAAANTARLAGKRSLQPMVPIVNNGQTHVNEAIARGLESRLMADGTQDALESFSMIATSSREVPNPTKGSLFSQSSRLDGSEPFLSSDRGSWSGDSSFGRNDGNESGGSHAETGSNLRDSLPSAYREVAKGASSVESTDMRPQSSSQPAAATSDRAAASQVSVQIVNQIVEHLERMRQTERNHVRVVLGDQGESRLTADIRMVGGKIQASFEGDADAMAHIRKEWDLIRDHARELGVALDEPEYLSDPWSGEDSVLFPVSGPSGDENPNVIQHNNQSVRPAYKTAATGSSGPVHLYA